MKHNICPTCNTKAVYASRFDSFICPKCDSWLESKCAEGCEYCTNRPDLPSHFYLKKPKTLSTVMGAVMSLEHFKSLVASEAIMIGDGCVGSIFVDGVD